MNAVIVSINAETIIALIYTSMVCLRVRSLDSNG
jgi:hypothetical protein